MVKKKTDESFVRRTLVQVARLYFEENLSQQEIADRLGVSRSLIAQYMQRARDAGIVHIQIIDQDDSCADLAAELKKETGVRQIIVVPKPHVSEELAHRAVASAAADFLIDQLREGDRFGLAWGRTSSLLVDLLKPPHLQSIDVIPLMGESGHSGMHSQMNQLVVRAAENLHATPHFLSLPMVLSTPKLRNALIQEVGISDVIDLWDHINLACVGIGVVPPVPGMVVYVGEEHLPRLVKAGAVGDMCGIYFDREGQIIKNGLENRMISASHDQLKAIDCLVAVACGSDKAVAVLGAMRTGLISTLFIDQNMAEKILAGLSATNSRKT
ncbi:MAG: sigma factor-like helix-turn-helix DNA-binding protein [Verrucomicrobia bacterium]|nr:sigma factor-like helix-turn-helix DNA-binding protein [Verrucomicrobiota bacterium]